MKKLTRNINYDTSPANIYNQMKKAPGTSPYEAIRTLQAIKTVKEHPQLFDAVICVSEWEED